MEELAGDGESGGLAAIPLRSPSLHEILVLSTQALLGACR